MASRRAQTGDAPELDLALKIDAGLDDVALREVLRGEDQAGPHRLPGGGIGLSPVALHVEVVGLVADAKREHRAVVQVAQPVLPLRGCAVADLLVVDHAVAHRRVRRSEPEGHPFLVDDLRGVVELPVHPPRQHVEAAVGEGVVEREPLAPLRVDGRRRVDEIGETPEIQQSVVREPVRFDAGVVHLGGGAEPVARRCVEDQLGQDLLAFGVLRIRRRAGVVQRFDGTLVADFAASVETGEHRRLDPLAAPGEGDVHADVVGAAVPGGLGADVEPLVPKVVGGILGEQGHDTPQRVAPVQRGVGAPHDLDRLQDVHVESRLMDVERTEVELLRGLNAVDHRHDAVPADAADVEAVQSEPGHAVLDVDARLVLHEVREVLDHPFLDRLAVDDRDHPRGVPHRGRPQRRRDCDGIEKGERVIGRPPAVAFRIGGRTGVGRLVVGGFLPQDGARAGQDQDQCGEQERPRRGAAGDASGVGWVNASHFLYSLWVSGGAPCGVGARRGVLARFPRPCAGTPP